MVEDFQRGKLPTDDKKEPRKRKVASKQRDVLFGRRKTPEKKRRKTDEPEDGKPSKPAQRKAQSLMPIGGGGVVLSSKDSRIEGLTFSKLAPGFHMLGCVKEIHEDYILFSLPNIWTAFMLRETNFLVQKGQFLSVVITKVTQQPVKGGTVGRRIQVSCLPGAVNSVKTIEDAVPDTTVRCQVRSIEDHGIIMELGGGRRGFLPLDEIQCPYVLDEDDNSNGVPLYEGCVLDCVVRSSFSKGTGVLPLSLPDAESLVKQELPPTFSPTLSQLRPGALVRARVEKVVRNGLCVSICGDVFRGAIEVQHTGTMTIPKNRNECDEWKNHYNKMDSLLKARIVAVDAATKIVRLSMLSHVLELKLPVQSFDVGTVISEATVVKCEGSIGALLAIPPDASEEENMDIEDESSVAMVFVHISNSMDTAGKEKVAESVFTKTFAPSSKHEVRILNTSNYVDGIATGSTAPSTVSAHVLTHDDLIVGKVFKQVSVCAHLNRGSVMVDFGMNVRGVIPQIHLFDKAASSEFRNSVKRTKFAVGSCVDVRVLSVDSESRRCLLTAKKSLVKAENVFSSFTNVSVGDVGTGFVSKVDGQGLSVTFFNGVFGRVSTKSLVADSSIVNHHEAFDAGDVVNCRVVHKRQRSRPSHTEQGENLQFTELQLTLDVSGDSNSRSDLNIHSELVTLKVGALLPSRSMRVIEIVNGRQKSQTAFVPGYAIVAIKSSFLIDDKDRKAMSSKVQCKLPFDQLADEFPNEVVKCAASLDEFANQIISVGQKIEQKGLVLADPKKSSAEYASGTGKLTVVSIRPSFVRLLEDAGNSIPSPTSTIDEGDDIVGFVAHIDSKHGAFVRFLDGLTGLVPKKRGGLLLPLFHTLSTEVIAVDKSSSPPKILLGLSDSKGKSAMKAGDVIAQAIVKSISFFKITVEVSEGKNKGVVGFIHCTSAGGRYFKPTDTIAEAEEQEITRCHPFFEWKENQILKDLKVCSCGNLKNGSVVEFSMPNCDSKWPPRQGETIAGIIMSVSPTSGIEVALTSTISSFIAPLEVSNDVEKLRMNKRLFPIGARLQCNVLKHSKSHPGSVRLSLIRKKHNFEKEALAVGMITDKVKPSNSPAVMLEIGDGVYGRCCITELRDQVNWGKFGSQRWSEVIDDFKSKQFHRCRVLGKLTHNIYEVSLRDSRIAGDLDNDKAPSVGEHVEGFVISTNKAGCFVRLARSLEGRSQLKNISDGFVSDPAATFPQGRLVSAKVTSIKTVGNKQCLDLDLRSSTLTRSNEDGLKFDEIAVGETYDGRVSRLEDFGVFIAINGSNLRGMAHKSECSDSFVTDLTRLYTPGDNVRVFILKKDEGKQTIGLSLKPSRLTKELDSNATENVADASGTRSEADESEDDQDEQMDEKGTDEDEESDDSHIDDNDSADSDDESGSDDDSPNSVLMDTDVGFQWTERAPVSQEEDGSDSSSDEEEGDARTTHQSRRKTAKKRQEEAKLNEREASLADGLVDDSPETSADFERQLAGSPNSSELWIKYMAFYIAVADIDGARSVAKRAVSRIQFREEQEKLNVWCALLTLEWTYGSADSLAAAVTEACQHNNPKHVHLRLCEVMSSKSKDLEPETNEFYLQMCKRFRSKKQVWLAYMKYLLEREQQDQAYAISKRALQSLPTYKHVETISKFAQLLYEFGVLDRARTLFEGLLQKYPRRLDLLHVYVDKEVKFGEVEAARRIYTRLVDTGEDSIKLKLSDKQMKGVFKKWFAFEEVHGSSVTQDGVKDAARAFVDNSS